MPVSHGSTGVGSTVPASTVYVLKLEDIYDTEKIGYGTSMTSKIVKRSTFFINEGFHKIKWK